MANLILWNCLNIEYAPARQLASHQLASWLRQHGYTVKVIDFCHKMTTKELISITEKYIDADTLAIGVSATFWYNISVLAQHAKEPPWLLAAREELKNKKISWLIGGCHSNSINLVYEWIRFFGYAEDELLKWMDQNSGKLIRRELFDITCASTHFSKDDYIRPYEVLPIELGRGCQFKCRFCSYPLVGKKKGTYIKDYELIREEFIRNYNEFGTTKYYFLDDTVNESEEKVYALADIAQHLPFKLQWVGYNRLDLIWSRPGTIQALKDSGLRSTFFGIESFHPQASMAVGKGWNGKHVAKDFLLRLKDEWKGDITWMLSFIVGLPGETKEDITETSQWCIDNEMYNWSFYPLAINRSPSKLWKSEFDLEAEKYGYSFPRNTYEWENEHWTLKSAVEYSKFLNKRDYEHMHPTVWMLFMMSCLDYSCEDLMSKKLNTLPWYTYSNQTKKFVADYVKFHLVD